MALIDATAFRAMVDDVARKIVATEHRPAGSFIQTPLLYPSGATVVVRIHQAEGRYFVSDVGLGYQEAELMGAALIYARHARSIAENAGVGFDNQAFFVMEASREQLPGAVVTIANCSQEAAALSAYKLSERRTADEGERLFERLVTVFDKRVEKAATIIGSSNTQWTVAALVFPDRGRPTIFEPVTNHHSSIAHASMKFHDIALLEQAPNRVAVVQKKREFGTYLGVLSQAANVIDAEVPNETLVRLAKVA